MRSIRRKALPALLKHEGFCISLVLRSLHATGRSLIFNPYCIFHILVTLFDCTCDTAISSQNQHPVIISSKRRPLQQVTWV